MPLPALEEKYVQSHDWCCWGVQVSINLNYSLIFSAHALGSWSMNYAIILFFVQILTEGTYAQPVQRRLMCMHTIYRLVTPVAMYVGVRKNDRLDWCNFRVAQEKICRRECSSTLTRTPFFYDQTVVDEYVQSSFKNKFTSQKVSVDIPTFNILFLSLLF